MTRIYFDNAATTPVDDEVIDTILTTMRGYFGNPSSIHAEGRSARSLIESARKTVAQCIGASTAEVFFTSSATESNNMALKCAVRDQGIRRIISSKTEHHCGLHSIESLQHEAGIEVVWLPVDLYGRIDYQALEDALAMPDAPKTMVSLMHGNNEIGTMIDLDRVAALCAEHGALFHSDTVQTIGRFPIDVQKTRVHFLAGSAHKFHGPKGIGFVYIRSETPLKPFIDGGSQERNMRAGTENLYGIVGLAKALELACRHMEARSAAIRTLRDYLKTQLSGVFHDIQFNGTAGLDMEENGLYTVLSVSFPPSSRNEMLLLNLDIEGVSASGGSACTSGTEKGSHVLEAIGADPGRKSVRFSFSHFNSKTEVDLLVEKLKKILPQAVNS
jgi:cysteine desulfurase